VRAGSSGVRNANAREQALAEHTRIVEALDELGRAAAAEQHPEVSRFVEELTAHAQTEAQVLYPAAILVGAFLKLKSPGDW
jgi:hypothetical protein